MGPAWRAGLHPLHQSQQSQDAGWDAGPGRVPGRGAGLMFAEAVEGRSASGARMRQEKEGRS